MDIHLLSRRVASPLAGSVVAVALLVMAAPFIFSDFLTADDTIYLGRAALGEPIEAGRLGNVALINLVGTTTSSVIAPKLLALAALATTAALGARLLMAEGRSTLVAVVFAVFAVLYPISPEPGVFVAGSHPFFAAPFILGGLLVVRGLSDWPPLGRAVAIICAQVLVTVAAFMSATAALVTLAPALWVLLLCRIAGVRFRTALVDFTTAVIGFGLAAVTVFDYHYSGLEGWVDTSPGPVASNIVQGLGLAARPMVEGGLAGGLMLIALLTMVALTSWQRLRHRGDAMRGRLGRPDLRDSSLLLIASGLAFGPGLAVAGYSSRYVALAGVLALLSVGVVIARSVGGRLSHPRWLTLAGTALICTSVVLGNDLREITYGQQLRVHQEIISLIDAEGGRWEEDAQVVIVAAGKGALPTAGFNHWSTWYLRWLTRSPNLIGLVGREEWLDDEPVVEQYSDHSPYDYWEIIDGVSRRIRMRGLEANRPTYAYRLPGDREADPITFVADEVNWIFPGDPLSEPRPSPNNCTDERILWPRSSSPTALVDSTHLDYYDLEASDPQTFRLVEGSEEVVITFAPSAAGEDAYTDTSPPMPLLTDQVAVYQLDGAFRVADRIAETDWLVPDVEALKLQFTTDGCSVWISANGQVLGALAGNALPAQWTLGAGFLQRTWEGRAGVSGLEREQTAR